MRWIFLGLLALSLVVLRGEHVAGECNFNDASQCTAVLVKNVLEAFATAGLAVPAVNASAEIGSAVSSFTSACLGVQNVLRAVRFLTPSSNDGILASQAQVFTRATGFRAEFSSLLLSRIAEEVDFQLQTNVSLYDAWILDVQSAEGAMRAHAVALLDELVAAAATEQAELLAAAAAKEAARAANASANASAVTSAAPANASVAAAMAANSTAGSGSSVSGGVDNAGGDVEAEVAELRAAAERAGTADEDVHPFYRTHAASYLGNRTGVVVSGFMPLLYWRRDIFAARLNLTRPPATWSELLDVGRRLHGTDLNGDGQPDPALCWSSPGCSDVGVLLGALLASLIQHTGSSSGWLLSPDSLSPLAAGPPLHAALQLLGLMGGLEAAPGTAGPAYADGSTCALAHVRFFAGSCAMSINWPTQFKVAQLRFPRLRGNVGVAALPGSQVVWDREAGAWITCDSAAAACPFADTVPALQLPQLLNGTDNVVASGNGSSSNSSGAGSVRVNRAPFVGMSALVGAVDVRTPSNYRTAAFKFFTQLSSPNVSWAQLLDPTSAIGPFRLQHLDPASMGRWRAGGYDNTDLTDFLGAWRTTIEHPNVALLLRMPGAAGLRDALQWAATQVVGLGTPSGGLAAAPGSALVAGTGGPELAAAVQVAAAGLATRLRAALDAAGPLEQTQRIYWRTLNYTPPAVAAAPPPSHGGISDGQRITIAAVVSAVGAALCLAAALGGYAWYRRRQAARHRTLFGRMVAPGASPATCLVVTDIVDSTRLWESVQQLAMARAVQLHHDTLRQLLKETGGYESATEGDSFILSFYGPADAVAFCLRAQAALLACTWPAELLQQELCRPVYAVARSLAPTPPERGRGVVRGGLRPPRLPLGGGAAAAPAAPSVPAATEPNLSFGRHSGTLFGPLAQLGSQASALSGAGGSGAGGALSLGGRVRLGSTAGVAGTSTSPAGDVLGGAVTLAGVGSAAVAAAAGASVSLYRGGGASPGTGIQDGGTGGATAGMLTGLVVSELQAPPSVMGAEGGAAGGASGGGGGGGGGVSLPSPLFALQAQQQHQHLLLYQQQQMQMQRPPAAAAGSPTSRWFQPAAAAVSTSLRRLQAAMRPGSSTGMPDQPHSARSQRAGSSGVISAFAAAAGMTANAPTGPAAAGDPNSPGGGVLNAIMRSAGSVTALLSRGGSGGAASRAGTSPSQPGRRLLQTIQHGVGLSSTSSAPQHPLPLLSRSTNPSSWAAAATDVSPPHVLSHSQSQLQSQVQLQIRQQSLASGGSSRRPAPRQGSRLNYINNTPRTNSGSAVTFRSSGVTTAATVGGGGGPDSPVRFRSEAAVAGGPVSGGAVSGLRHLIRTVSGLSSASNSRRSHAMLQRAAGGSGDVGEYQAASLAGAATVAGLVSGPGAVGLGTWSPGRAAGLSPEPSGLDEIMSSTGEEQAGAAAASTSAASPIPVPQRPSDCVPAGSAAAAAAITDARGGGGRGGVTATSFVVSGGGASGGTGSDTPLDELGMMSLDPSPRVTDAAMIAADDDGAAAAAAATTSLLAAATIARVAVRPLGFHPAAGAAAARGSMAGEMPPSLSMGMAAAPSASTSGAMYGSGAVSVAAAAGGGAATAAAEAAAATTACAVSNTVRGTSASGSMDMNSRLPLPPYEDTHGGAVLSALSRAETRPDGSGDGAGLHTYSPATSPSQANAITGPSPTPLTLQGAACPPEPHALADAGAGASTRTAALSVFDSTAAPAAAAASGAAATTGAVSLSHAQAGMQRAESDLLRFPAAGYSVGYSAAAGYGSVYGGGSGGGYDRGGTADQLVLTTANMGAFDGATGSCAMSAAFALVTGQAGGGGGGGGVMGTMELGSDLQEPAGASPTSVGGAAYVSRASGTPGGGGGLLPMTFRRSSTQVQEAVGLGGGGGGGWAAGLLPSGPVMTETLDTSSYALQPFSVASLGAAATAAATAAMGPGRSMTLAEYYGQIYKVLQPQQQQPQQQQPQQQQPQQQQSRQGSQQLQSQQQLSPHSGNTVASQRSALAASTPVPSPQGRQAAGGAAETEGWSQQQQQQQQQALPAGAILMFCGLQVRMGVHAGVEPTEVSYNRVAGRTQYSGTALQFAKVVCDAAQGGMVLLSATAHEQLNKAGGAGGGGLGGGGGGGCGVPLVLDMGSHVVTTRPEPVQLYMAASRGLLCRVPALGPVRSREQLGAGVLCAPLGCVALGVLVVAGLPTLQAWDKAVTEEALDTFRRVVVTVALRQLGGQLVEEGPGRVLAAFCSAASAVRWAASCEALLKAADWSEALLAHELCEEVAGPVLLDPNMEGPVASAHDDAARCLFRGLRVRGAVDVARVKAELLPATGRLAYRGALAGNVGRMAAFVSVGQVVCTGRAWRCYQAATELAALTEAAAAAAAAATGGLQPASSSLPPPPLPVLGASLGLHSIRGVGDKLELWSLRLGGSAVEYFDSMSVMGTRQRDEIAAAAAQGLLGPGPGRPARATADAQAQLMMLQKARESTAAAAGAGVVQRTPDTASTVQLQLQLAGSGSGLPVWEVAPEDLRGMMVE